MPKYTREQVIEIVEAEESLEGADLSGIDLSGIDFSPNTIGRQPRKIVNLRNVDLTNSNLTDTDLRKANLTGANLRKANLNKANLRGTTIENSNFENATVRGAFLLETNARKANFCGADLINANLKWANFMEANFLQANLPLTSFNASNLRGANLNETNLGSADMSLADLGFANFDAAKATDANFRKATINNASLKNANLSNSILIGADLTEADLRGAILKSVDFENACLKKANISGANIFHIKTNGWKIEDIICTHIYHIEFAWDIQKKKEVYCRNFRPGEFKELYEQLPTIEYFFKNGFTPIDAVLMDQVVQIINKKNPEFQLKLDSFHSRIQPHAKFTITHKDYIEKASKEITHQYEQKICKLEEKLKKANIERDAYVSIIHKAINEPKKVEIIMGDYVKGDKVEGDKIERDKIEVHGAMKNNDLTEINNIISQMLQSAQKDDSISKNQYSDIEKKIEELISELKKDNPRESIIGPILSYLGNMASITSFIDKLVPFLPVLL